MYTKKPYQIISFKKKPRNLSSYFSKQNENIEVTLEKGAETFDMLITTLLIFNISFHVENEKNSFKVQLNLLAHAFYVNNVVQ